MIYVYILSDYSYVHKCDFIFHSAHLQNQSTIIVLVRIRTMLYTKREVTNSFPHPMLICRCAFSCNVLTGDIHIVGLLEEIKQQMKMHSALLQQILATTSGQVDRDLDPLPAALIIPI